MKLAVEVTHAVIDSANTGTMILQIGTDGKAVYAVRNQYQHGAGLESHTVAAFDTRKEAEALLIYEAKLQMIEGGIKYWRNVMINKSGWNPYFIELADSYIEPKNKMLDALERLDEFCSEHRLNRLDVAVGVRPMAQYGEAQFFVLWVSKDPIPFSEES